jgi:hypothetical protein
MALDLLNFKLINITGDGRDGIQGRMFTLGTFDDLSTATAAGYLDDLVNLEIPFNNRAIVDGDVIFLQYGISVTTGSVTSGTWVPTIVSYNSTTDSYTLTVLDWGTGGGGGGSGTVTSVGLTMPSEFSVASSPVTTSGSLTVTKAVQSANEVFVGPATGADAAPTFRNLVEADVPATLVQRVPYFLGTEALSAPTNVFQITVPGMLATDIVMVYISNLGVANSVLVGTAVSSGQFQIEFSINPGASTTINYLAFHV